MVRATIRALLLVALAIGITVLVFPMPSNDDDRGNSRTCIAVRDGWSREPQRPPASEIRTLMDPQELFSPSPTPTPIFDRWEKWDLSVNECGRETRNTLVWVGGFVVVCGLGLYGLAVVDRRKKRVTESDLDVQLV
jgi:hypothetical protein